MTPLKHWTKLWFAAAAAWVEAHPKPPPPDWDGRAAWRLAKEQFREQWQCEYPPPDRTDDEEQQADKLRELNRMLGGTS